MDYIISVIQCRQIDNPMDPQIYKVALQQQFSTTSVWFFPPKQEARKTELNFKVWGKAASF